MLPARDITIIMFVNTNPISPPFRCSRQSVFKNNIISFINYFYIIHVFFLFVNEYPFPKNL